MAVQSQGRRKGRGCDERILEALDDPRLEQRRVLLGKQHVAHRDCAKIKYETIKRRENGGKEEEKEDSQGI